MAKAGWTRFKFKLGNGGGEVRMGRAKTETKTKTKALVGFVVDTTNPQSDEYEVYEHGPHLGAAAGLLLGSAWSLLLSLAAAPCLGAIQVGLGLASKGLGLIRDGRTSLDGKWQCQPEARFCLASASPNGTEQHSNSSSTNKVRQDKTKTRDETRQDETTQLENINTGSLDSYRCSNTLARGYDDIVMAEGG
ncbi:hypothetical protein BKA67DRAFT_540219 [Truncatella angustata]|uniref:Uncharacterized protein n=1 Tax=Truncatella angustata TaxID=152316 RepID=A0A9P8RIZ7_9PEZI|nr:uncharacterized protein BKA67DRAFT_540219 [Truncatella angustata]KAH6646724.1 hypothetical protein BKA67DRAFT_540219 [Truncatella angustata]